MTAQKALFANYQWTAESRSRLNILAQYEPIQMDVFFSYLDAIRAEVFLDVGANIGAYSVCASGLKHFRKGFLFEPSPEAFRTCQQNVALNGLEDKLTCMNCAVSDRSGTNAFAIAGPLSGINAISDTSIHRQSKYLEHIEVETRTLDELLKFEGERIGIKIDVEGHERNVIKGAQRLLASNIGVIQAELGYKHSLPVIDLLQEFGYHKIISIGPDFYFSNEPSMRSPAEFLPIIETQLARLIALDLERQKKSREVLDEARETIRGLEERLKAQSPES